MRRRFGQRLGLFGVSLAVVAATMALAGASPSAQAATSDSAGRAPVPASAFKSSPGLTSSTVTVANVSTESLGLFTGSIVGTKAYAAYVNSQGGVNGRKIVVNAQDDLFTGAQNKQLTQSAIQNDFAMVGSFSLEDSFAEPVIAQNPGFPDVSTTLSPALARLPNTYSANPSGKGWPTGPASYFARSTPAR